MGFNVNRLIRKPAVKGARRKSNKKAALPKESIPGIAVAFASMIVDDGTEEGETREEAFRVRLYVRHESPIDALIRAGIVDESDAENRELIDKLRKPRSRATIPESWILEGLKQDVERRYERADGCDDAPLVIGATASEGPGWGYADLRFTTDYKTLEAVGAWNDSLQAAVGSLVRDLAYAFDSKGRMTSATRKAYKAS